MFSLFQFLGDLRSLSISNYSIILEYQITLCCRRFCKGTSNKERSFFYLWNSYNVILENHRTTCTHIAPYSRFGFQIPYQLSFCNTDVWGYYLCLPQTSTFFNLTALDLTFASTGNLRMLINQKQAPPKALFVIRSVGKRNTSCWLWLHKGLNGKKLGLRASQD